MPYVDLVSSDDYASIWYFAQTPNGNVGGFDPDKPTIIMLHPLFLDSTWLHPQLDDPRLYGSYNLVAFDTRTTGKSISRYNGRHDLWVGAADLALAIQHLNLPPAHIFASELYSYIALRLAALFPELCLSLTLCNVPAQTEIKSVFDAMEELCQLWSYAEDLESFESACKELLDFYVGPGVHADLIDDLVAYWEVHYPPFRRSKVMSNINLILNRTPMTSEELAAVNVPVLIMQAERSQTHPMEYVEKLREAMTNVPSGATLFTVKAAQGYLGLFSASIVNQVFHKFLSRQPLVRSDLKPPSIPIKERMTIALKRLAEFKRDPSIATRDPYSPLSFSCVSEEISRSQQESWSAYLVGERQAFSPLSSDGRPQRKFSERKDNHWLDAGADGYSYSNTKRFVDPPERKRPARTGSGPSSTRPGGGGEASNLVLPPSEPVSEEFQSVARQRRSVVTPAAVDRHIIKGSMAKVVASSASGGTGVALPRILRS